MWAYIYARGSKRVKLLVFYNCTYSGSLGVCRDFNLCFVFNSFSN